MTEMEDTAARIARGSPEAAGPHIINDRADALTDVLSPQASLYEADYLVGRITLTLEEVKWALGIGERTLRTAMKNGEIPSVKIGGRRLVPVSALTKHLDALAYAESGALDAWEAALVKAATNRMKIARRRAWERRKYLRRKLAAARRAGLEQGAIGRDHLTNLRAELAELERQGAVTEKFTQDLSVEIDAAEREFGLTEAAMEAPRLGLERE